MRNQGCMLHRIFWCCYPWTALQDKESHIYLHLQGRIPREDYMRPCTFYSICRRMNLSQFYNLLHMNEWCFMQISSQIMGMHFSKVLSGDSQRYRRYTQEHRLYLDPIDFPNMFRHKYWEVSQQRLERDTLFNRIQCLDQRIRLVGMSCHKCW